MSSNNNHPFDEFWENLDPEKKSEIQKLFANSELHIKFLIELRHALEMSSDEFWTWIREDEFPGIPDEARLDFQGLSLKKLLDRVHSDKGFVEIKIARKGKAVVVSFP